MNMWRLDEFRFDEGIDAVQVHVHDALAGHSRLMSRTDAIAVAHSRDAHLIAWWPPGGDGPPACVISPLTLPLRWERVAQEPSAEIDMSLWFEATCGQRDVLIPEKAHTFAGRMRAWCPHKQVSYNVSLGEMGEMSEPTRYFILGYLAGSEPGPPYDEQGDIDDADLEAWRSATARFRRTGSWYGRWGTCQVCGCVLLPDNDHDRCDEHSDDL